MKLNKVKLFLPSLLYRAYQVERFWRNSKTRMKNALNRMFKSPNAWTQTAKMLNRFPIATVWVHLNLKRTLIPTVPAILPNWIFLTQGQKIPSISLNRASSTDISTRVNDNFDQFAFVEGYKNLA